ncbi:MAG: phosphoglucosamine mutase [Candidatus Krumholzibacteria bacterium]|nr:phosphoglucosamine mutase [Candidatus Krumholzibacteria bacterium]
MGEQTQDKLLFSVAGARGVVGKGLNVEVATRLTLAFSAILPPGPVVVGRDTRPSGKSLLCAVIAALTATGRECIHLDIATTPTVEMMVEKLDAAGGIVVTASHNPVEWNALKFLDKRGIFITKSDSERLYDAYTDSKYQFVDAAATGKITAYERGARDHIDAILGLHTIDVDRIARRSFRVVVDCINGAGSVMAAELLQALGATVIEMNCKTDGDFYRDPEPRAENLRELADRVKVEGAHLGFALDPDADRLALVDDNGKALSEELTLALAVDQVLETEKKGPVVVNLSTSALIDWVASQYQATVVRTPVGEAHVVDRMSEERAPIGGEGNGGVIYPELHPGRDALLGMALILQLLADRELSLSEQVGRYPVFFMSKDKLALGGDFSPKKISDLIRGLGPARIDASDGVKAIFDDGWCHLRVSNTEGMVRIIAESLTEERTATLSASARSVLNTAWNR